MKPNNVLTTCGLHHDGAHDPGRRKFLLAVGGIAVAACFRRTLTLTDPPPVIIATEMLTRELMERPHVERIGRAFLAASGTAIPNRNEIRERLAATLRELPCAGVPSKTAYNLKHLRDGLQQIIRRDFILGHTVRLEGWVVSLTEAQLCGLATA